MEDVQIRLSGLWVALMLTYLLGDVLRIFSGDFKAGEIGGMKVTQVMWLGIAILMVIPIVMVFLSLTLKNPANRWAKHHRSDRLLRFQSHRTAYIPFGLRQILDSRRPWVQ